MRYPKKKYLHSFLENLDMEYSPKKVDTYLDSKLLQYGISQRKHGIYDFLKFWFRGCPKQNAVDRISLKFGD